METSVDTTLLFIVLTLSVFSLTSLENKRNLQLIVPHSHQLDMFNKTSLKKNRLKLAIDHHPSRPLISLVPIRPAPPIVFSDMGIIISPSLLISRPITNLVWIGHNILCCPSKICISIVFNFSWDLQSPQEKLKLMLMQTFGETIKSIMVFLKKVFRCRSAQKWNACFHTGIN